MKNAGRSRKRAAPFLRLEGGEDFFVEVFRAFHTVPGAVFIFEGEDSHELCVEHDADAAGNVVVFPAVPIFGVHDGVGVGGDGGEAVIVPVFVLPVAEVGGGFAEGAVDFIDDDADVHRISSEAPVIFESDFDADFGTVVGHFFEGLDAVIEEAGEVIVLWVVGCDDGAGNDAGAAAIDAHGFGTDEGGTIEPFFRDFDAGAAFGGVGVADVAGSVVGDVLASGSRGGHFGVEFFKPFLCAGL